MILTHLLSHFCRPADAPALTTAAHALLTIFPQPSEEREFTHARQALESICGYLSINAAAHKNLTLDLTGREEAEPLLATLKWVSDTQLFPRVSGIRARRYLAALLIECLASQAESPSHDVLELATVIRGELKALRRNPTERAPIPDKDSFLAFIGWLDNLPQGSERFPSYFWAAWKRSLSTLAKRVILYPASTSPGLDELDEDESGVIIPALDDDAEAQPSSAIGVLPTPGDDRALEKYSSGTRTTILQSALSTVTPLSALTDASNTVLSDVEASIEVRRLVAQAQVSLDNGHVLPAEAAIGRLLILATGTSTNRLRELTWEATMSSSSYPGSLSLDGDWLLRTELRPEGAAEGVAEEGGGVVWIPLPLGLRNLLRRLTPTPRAGDYVLPTLHKTGGGNALEVSTDSSAPHLVALRHTLLSRLARAEPLGLTAAQWVAGDSLGTNLAPLHYDRYPADRLAQLVEKFTFKWFSERPGRARKVRAKHLLGSRVAPRIQAVRDHFAALRHQLDLDDTTLAERVSCRTNYVIHGLAALSGHRPNNAFGEYTIHQFGMPDPIAVIADKRVSADWQHRPVVLPNMWQREFAALLEDLSHAAATEPPNALTYASRAALSGDGPIFLDVQSVDDVSAYSVAAYVRDLPADLLPYRNFARHLLNSELMGRVPEAVRVAQLGWHGGREGAWAHGSPWSPLDLATQLERPITQHLKNIGWIPSADAPTHLPEGPSLAVDWLQKQADHKREFQSTLSRLKKEMAIRHALIARSFAPKLEAWLADNCPQLKLSANGNLARTSETAMPHLVELTQMQLSQIEHMLSCGSPRSLIGAVARNMLSAMCRKGRQQGLLACPIPRRVIWRYPSRPGPFHAAQPMALRAGRVFDQWLVSLDSQAEPDDSSEYAIAACAVLFHGGYHDVGIVLSLLSDRATLHRSRHDPSVLLVNLDSGDGDDASDGEFAQPWMCPYLRSYAFHGLAALHLMRWHAISDKSRIAPTDLSTKLFQQLPVDLRPQRPEDTLMHIAELAKACHVLQMDGMARLVTTGIVTPTCIDARRIIALRDGTTAPRIEQVESTAASSATAGAPETKPLSLRNIYGILSRAVAAVKGDRRTESAQRDAVQASLFAWCSTCPSNPGTIDLIARFALALVQRGGRRKKHLQLETIRGYVYAAAPSLLARLAPRPLSASSSHWQDIFFEIIATSSPALRAQRLIGLRIFHWILSQEFTLPVVDFGPMESIAGMSTPSVDAGYFTNQELNDIAKQLSEDIKLLQRDEASQGDIHLARLREVTFHVMAAAGIRTGEANGLRINDVERIDMEGIRVRASRYSSMKSFNARRRVVLIGPCAASARQAVNLQRRRFGPGSRGKPLIDSMKDGNQRVSSKEIIPRIAELSRWATGLSAARPYWLRKTNAWHRLSNLQEQMALSLWPLRDLIAAMGHGSILTTLQHYVHDPILPFARWFRTIPYPLGVERSATAAGSHRWAAVRRKAGDNRTRDARNMLDRVASILGKVKFEPLADSRDLSAPSLIADSIFAPTLIELDSLLRRVVGGSPISEATDAHRWPDAASDRLTDALEHLKGNYGLVIGETDQTHKFIGPPRRLKRDGNVMRLVLEPTGGQVLSEMAAAWISHARIPGLPHGVPAPPSTWTFWEKQLPKLAGMKWDIKIWGAMEVRSPSGQRTSPFPLLRWMLLCIWLHQAVTTGQGQPPSSREGSPNISAEILDDACCRSGS